MPSHALHALSVEEGRKIPLGQCFQGLKISANEISSLDLRLQAAMRLPAVRPASGNFSSACTHISTITVPRFVHS
jgi:hypothetical protein